MTSSKRIALLLLALTPFSCREKDDKQPASDNQNWSLATPESKGMDPGILDKSKQYAFQEGKNTQGVLIIKDGAIVAEWYKIESDSKSPVTSWSMAKSVVSLLIGAAIDRGLIAGTEVEINSYFPEWENSGNFKITLAQLMEMRSGLAWVESEEAEVLATQTQDQLASSLARTSAIEPGIQFNYSSADSMLFSRILTTATGQPVQEFAKEVLFDPLGFQGDWWTDAEDHTLTYCCIDATPRSFARIGQLIVQNGFWNETEIIPSEWIQQSTEPAQGLPFYGLQWWTNGEGEDGKKLYDDLPAEMVIARGYHGQYIYIIPSLDLVVTRHSTYEVDEVNDHKANPGVRIRTLAPDSWNDGQFLTPIIDSLGGK